MQLCGFLHEVLALLQMAVESDFFDDVLPLVVIPLVQVIVDDFLEPVDEELLIERRLRLLCDNQLLICVLLLELLHSFQQKKRIGQPQGSRGWKLFQTIQEHPASHPGVFAEISNRVDLFPRSLQSITTSSK